MNFIDSYRMKWKLCDENGLEWEEEFDNISLSDFEELYGNNVHQILEFGMWIIDESV